MRFFALVVLAAAALVVVRPNDPMARFPQTMVWAWERPEDLRSIDPRQTGVAFLARTVSLRGDQVIVRPRMQALAVPESTTLMAVVRIEADRAELPKFSTEQRSETVEAIEEAGRMGGISGVQVDFDARLSERPFYRKLLRDVRRRLPRSQALSVTALASWCLGDDWLSGLPLDEAVPMLFRMGEDHHRVVLHLEAGGDFRSRLCRGSVGISTDETSPQLPSGRRVYLFRPGPRLTAETRSTPQ